MDVELFQDIMSLQLESGSQLAAGNAEVCGQEIPLLDSLCVGRGLSVGLVEPGLDGFLNVGINDGLVDSCGLKIIIIIGDYNIAIF